MKTTKFKLFSALADGTPLYDAGLTSVVSIERESGWNDHATKFNVTGWAKDGRKVTVFIETTD